MEKSDKLGKMCTVIWRIVNNSNRAWRIVNISEDIAEGFQSSYNLREGSESGKKICYIFYCGVRTISVN